MGVMHNQLGTANRLKPVNAVHYCIIHYYKSHTYDPLEALLIKPILSQHPLGGELGPKEHLE